MRRLQMIFTVLIFICSCQTKSSNSAEHTNDSANVKMTKPEGGISTIDTLNKYNGSDSLYKFGAYIFYAGTANKKEFGFIQTTDSTSIIYCKYRLN
jgi:uncharacterized protein YpmB